MHTNLYSDLFTLIKASPERHANSDPLWRVLRAAARAEVERTFCDGAGEKVPFGPLGVLEFPYHNMGNIDSLDLFGIDELIILAFYDSNRARYERAVDFGANIGLHSIGMARAGFSVRSFEPDPVHFGLLKRNLGLNAVETEIHQSAVSIEAGRAEFVRVLGNTTGSHIAGAKKDPYGKLDRFEVELEAAEGHLRWADLAKIDIEGHEAELLTGLPIDVWADTDAVLEVGTAENAEIIWNHLGRADVNLFSQMTGWSKVTSLSEMPTSHRDGSLFISSKSEMPWTG